MTPDKILQYWLLIGWRMAGLMTAHGVRDFYRSWPQAPKPLKKYE